MCLAFVSWQQHATYRLVLLVNRDESYARPTQQAYWWPSHPSILAGQDLQQKGTWLGITEKGSFAVLTNHRNKYASIPPKKRSRGQLPVDFLLQQTSPEDYVKALNTQHYEGFHLLVGNLKTLCYANNDTSNGHPLGPGLYGLSNGLLDEPWFKVQRGKERFEKCLSQTESEEAKVNALFNMMQDTQQAPNHLLPNTGFPTSWEKKCSSAFVKTNGYGTRTTTLLMQTHDGKHHLIERTYDSGCAQPVRSYRF